MSHRCPAPECSRKIPNHLFACRADWYRLPKDIRDRIWATASSFGADRQDAVAAAVEHWRMRLGQ